MSAAGSRGRMPIRDVVGDLRRLAGRLLAPQDPSDRQRCSTLFWDLARRVRSGQPPLLLPHRVAQDKPRIAYFVSSDDVAALTRIATLHSAAESPAVLLSITGSRGAGGVKTIDLSTMQEPQVVRFLADADPDILVDVGGCAMARMPLVLAMHPARRIVEPLCDPPCADAPGLASISDVGTIEGLVATAQRLATLDTPSLPPGLAPAALARELEGGVRSHRSGDVATALAAYRSVLSRYPDHPLALYLLAQLQGTAGDTDAALLLLGRAISVAPEFRDAHYASAQRLAEKGEWDAALAGYRAAIELTPQFAAGWSGFGLAKMRAEHGDLDAAIDALDGAVSLEPDSAQWRFNLGTALQRAGRLDDAIGEYREALQRDPSHREARFNLGSALQEIGDPNAAIGEYRAVLAADAAFAQAYPELGACLQQTGRVEEWIENFRAYRERCPASLSMAVYGLEATMAMGEAEAHARLRDGIAAGAFPCDDIEEAVNAWEQLLFLLLHVDLERSALLAAYERYDALATAAYGSPMQQRVRGEGPLRIGYVSGDLRDHVMGRMVHEWVARHDRSRFAVTLYSLSREHDAWTDRFRALDARWRDLSALTLDQATAVIAGDDIDILVDCSGHTRAGRPGLFARKPARIQATHIATPGPLGLRAVDYKLTDELSEADDAQRYLIETLLPVPGGVFPWHRYGAEPAVRTRGVADPFVCGAFVSLMKLSPRCLALWRRLLEAIPQAVLAFSPPSTEWHASYLRWLGANGIGPDRVAFLDHPPDEASRLRRYDGLDVSLDPMPCGNVNGTMESLAMGVPVISLAGLRHGERLGHALLSRFGLTETIARSEDDYIAIAARLAGDVDGARSLRERIARLARESEAWNSEAQVRAVESTFERIAVERDILPR